MSIKYLVNVFCMSSKMEFTRYLESLLIAKICSFFSNSTLQEFSLIPQRKNETVFENLPVLHKFPITTLHFLTATTNLSNSFSGSNQSLRNHPRVLGHMNFYMGIKFVRFEQDYWQFFFFRGVHV